MEGTVAVRKTAQRTASADKIKVLLKFHVNFD